MTGAIRVIKEDDFLNYAMLQFTKRRERIMKARGQTLEEVYLVTRKAIEADDA